ncbi:MAG: tetratricopeptide repeat protein [Candidatus Comchoanobacterales bacterium]
MKQVHEIDRDRFSEWVHQYWQPVIAILLAIVLAYSLIEFLSYRNKQYNATAGDDWYQLVKKDKLELSEIDAFIKQYPDTSWSHFAYLVRGAMKSAGLDSSTTEDAIKDFNVILNESKDDILKDNTRIKLALLAVTQGKNDEAIKLFNDVVSLPFKIQSNLYKAYLLRVENRESELVSAIGFANDNQQYLSQQDKAIYASLEATIRQKPNES